MSSLVGWQERHPSHDGCREGRQARNQIATSLRGEQRRLASFLQGALLETGRLGRAVLVPWSVDDRACTNVACHARGRPVIVEPWEPKRVILNNLTKAPSFRRMVSVVLSEMAFE